MRRLLVVSLALAGVTALPLTSSAGPVDDLVSSTGLSIGTSTTALAHERLVGVTWRSGDATVRYRWHSATGWSAWQTADEDTSIEGIPGTEPLWRPPGADLAQLRVSGDPRGLRLARVFDGRGHLRLMGVARAATARPVLGEVQTRADWGADESWVRRSPSYASKVVAVTVHHTDNANGYAPDDVPAMIRADYAYHVRTRGWADLGYNLLVDTFGRVWEGRRGGLGRATIGSHAQGFNTGTLGVAVLGDMTKARASTAAKLALARVVGYAASTWHFDPRTTVRLTSKGSPRYPSGRVVTVHRVFGHGETGVTDCPGSLQQDLPEIRELGWLATQPAPRILATRLSGAPVHAPSPAVLEGQLSARTRWVAVFTDGTGAVVARAAGRGSRPLLRWDGRRNGLPVLPGSYGWTLTVSDGFHAPARRSGSFTVGLPSATAVL